MEFMTPSEALKRLKSGNRRFVENKQKFPRTGAERLRETASGQNPMALTLTCADSRTPPEYIFDQGIGDIFVIRNAGNVCGPNVLASVELGIGICGAPLLMVMGHRNCGAVAMAVENAEVSPVVQTTIDKIKPAVESARRKFPGLTGDDLIQQAAKENTFNTLADILRSSSIVRDGIRKRKLLAVAAFYDIETGEVEWLGSHPEQERISGEQD